jgi:hypothetical protein
MYNFKTLTGNTKFLSYKQWPVGKFVVGTITGFRPNAKNPKNQDVIITVLDTNIQVPNLSLSKNDPFTINGTTALQKVLGSVEEGDIIKVTYEGTETVKTGQWKGTQANKLKVEVAPAQEKENFVAAQESEDEDLV